MSLIFVEFAQKLGFSRTSKRMERAEPPKMQGTLKDAKVGKSRRAEVCRMTAKLYILG